MIFGRVAEGRGRNGCKANDEGVCRAFWVVLRMRGKDLGYFLMSCSVCESLLIHYWYTAMSSLQTAMDAAGAFFFLLFFLLPPVEERPEDDEKEDGDPLTRGDAAGESSSRRWWWLSFLGEDGVASILLDE